MEVNLTNFKEGDFYDYNVVVSELKLNGFYTQAELSYKFSKNKLWTGFYAGSFFTYHQNILNNVIAYDDLGYNYNSQIDLQVFSTGFKWLSMVNK